MAQPVIQIENIGKQYRLGKVGTGSIAHDIQRWWAITRGKEDPYLKIGEVNNRTQKGESDWVWALQDISFDVQQGDVLGIIGKNGAGKSTLLKLLSRVTQPTTGSMRVKGRIASLLEVGTGYVGCAQAVVENAQLQLDLGLIALDQQQTLQRRDGTFDVAHGHRDLREVDEHRGIRRLVERRLKRNVIGRTLGQRLRVRRRSGLRSGLWPTLRAGLLQRRGDRRRRLRERRSRRHRDGTCKQQPACPGTRVLERLHSALHQLVHDQL